MKRPLSRWQKRTTGIMWGMAFCLGLAQVVAAQSSRFGDAPKGFVPPLHPAGVQLTTKALAPGVYALLASKPPVDNNGFIVGERGVLVIDAHINGAMARQIQAAVRQVTDKPILYVVNTNYHGDHTFGNYAFPAETQIVAHRATEAAMQNFEQEKKFLPGAVNNDTSVYADARLRLPDVVFDKFMRIDLGDQVVELHHFGPGNTKGDTVVYAPGAQAAWTGNLVVGEGSIPFLIEGGAEAYLATVANFARALDVKTIIPGHGIMTTSAVLDRYSKYLNELIASVRKSTQAGHTLTATLEKLPLGQAYVPPADSPLARLGPFIQGLHLWNVQQTFKEFNRS